MNPPRVRIDVRTAAPPTRDVYTNLNHVLEIKKSAEENLQEGLTVSAVLSAIVSIFDWDALDTKYVNPVGDPQGAQIPEVDADATNTVLYLAMGSVMHCVKPISAENVKYVKNRWSALTATIESTGAIVPKITMDSAALITISTRCRPYIKPNKVVEKLIVGDADYAEMYNQIKMVYSYAGMKLVEEMKRFSTKPYTCAILLSSVMEQAKNYLAKYNMIKGNHVNTFEFARIILKNEIEPLDAANFPDLYWGTFYSMQSHVSSNFKTSSHEPNTPRDVIKRFAKVLLTDFGTLSDENKKILESLGVDLEVALRKAEQLTKRRTPHVSDDSESDTDSDSEPRRKRRKIR